jgi:hypothetical protein
MNRFISREAGDLKSARMLLPSGQTRAQAAR